MTAGYRNGHVVQMKKPHPCGSYEWEILKTGLFVQIRCCGCGRHVEMRRDAFEKGIRKKIDPGGGYTDEQ